MVSGQPYAARRYAGAIAASLSLLVSAACGSTSVQELSGPGPVRCAASLSAEPATVPADGTNVTVRVTAARDCTWSARSDVSWMQVRSASGQGEGTFAATVARNDLAAARSGGIIVNDQRLGITQEGRGCAIALSGSAVPVPAPGGRRSISVSTLAGCPWAAETSAPWVVLVNASGAGPATLAFDVSANPGPAREATITVGGQVYVVSQEATPTSSCTFAIDPASRNFPVAGGEGTIAVATATGCAWIVEGVAPWVSVLGASGTGNGTVRYVVSPNPGVSTRTTTITVAGRAHTITQQGLVCTFSLSPGSAAFPAAGGPGTVQVNTLPGCPWTASSNAGWVTVGAFTGVGPATVPYTVQANAEVTGRTASLTIGGQTHTITQAPAPPPCTYTLDPPARSFTAAAAAGAVRVNTAATCAWAASSSVPWIAIAEGSVSGVGSADVTYSVALNTTPASRTGTVIVGGQAHTVTQDAAAPACTYALAPAERVFTAAGGSGVVTVATAAGCAWAAVSSEPWVVVTTQGGSGTADIAYTVAAAPPNTTRTATITVNGQVHTVRQTP